MKAKPERHTTSFGGTETTVGFIPHATVVYGDTVIHAPVKLDVPKRGGCGLRAPLRRDGKLAYALPGGEELVP